MPNIAAKAAGLGRAIGWYAAVLGVLCALPLAAAKAQDLTQWNLEGPLFEGSDTTPIVLPNGQVRLYSAVCPTAVVGGTASLISSDGRNFTCEPGARLSSSVAFGGGALPRIVPLANGQYRMFFSNNLTEGAIPAASIARSAATG